VPVGVRRRTVTGAVPLAEARASTRTVTVRSAPTVTTGRPVTVSRSGFAGTTWTWTVTATGCRFTTVSGKRPASLDSVTRAGAPTRTRAV
jgi:hypothetical protein